MSSIKTGAKAEKLYFDLMVKDKWPLVKRWPKVRFGEQDIFGCDLVVKGNGQTLWIQVKSSKHGWPPVRSEVLKQLQILKSHCSANEQVLLALYKFDTKEWKELVI